MRVINKFSAVLLLMVFIPNNSYAEPDFFGTFSSRNGAVIELSRDQGGSITGEIFQVAPNAHPEKLGVIRGLNTVAGKLQISVEDESVEYLRRTVEEVTGDSTQLYTEWYTDQVPNLLPDAFRSIIAGESGFRAQNMSAVHIDNTVPLAEFIRVRSAIKEYYGSEGEGNIRSPMLTSDASFTSPRLVGSRSSMAWLEAYTGAAGIESFVGAGVYPDTLGGNLVISSLPGDEGISALQKAIFIDRMPDLSTGASLSLVPKAAMHLDMVKLWQMEIPSPNFMSTLADSDWNHLDEEEVAKLTGYLDASLCGIRPPKDRTFIIVCDYFSHDVGIKHDRWFWTAMTFTIDGSYKSNPSKIRVWPSTLTIEGGRDDYKKLAKSRGIWHGKVSSSLMRAAESVLRSKVEDAIYDLYN